MVVAQVRIAKGVSLPDSWQSKVLLASHSMMSGSEEDSYESDEWFYNYNVDNTSNRCANWFVDASADCSSCETKVLIRWARILFYKVARTYKAAPLMLMLLPLCIGLLVGVVIGRRCGPGTQERAQLSKSKLHGDSNGIFGWSYCILRSISCYLSSSQNLEAKESRVRAELKSDSDTARESGVDLEHVPRHVAVIMDGNRRYGRARYGNVSKGHWDGSKTLVDFAKWCIAEGVEILSVYAFSTENWNRDPSEVASLMKIFVQYCDELRVEAIERNIRIHVLSTDTERIPGHVKAGLNRMVDETKNCKNGLTMNICLSYGSRGEIVNACKSLAMDAQEGNLQANDISAWHISQKLLTSHCVDPDVLIRTSGEYRLSNYLLWQLAYTELFFVPKQWPELQKSDLLQVIRTYANGRRRRFGK